jgi:hypothetical protein
LVVIIVVAVVMIIVDVVAAMLIASGVQEMSDLVKVNIAIEGLHFALCLATLHSCPNCDMI